MTFPWRDEMFFITETTYNRTQLGQAPRLWRGSGSDTASADEHNAYDDTLSRERAAHATPVLLAPAREKLHGSSPHLEEGGQEGSTSEEPITAGNVKKIGNEILYQQGLRLHSASAASTQRPPPTRARAR